MIRKKIRSMICLFIMIIFVSMLGVTALAASDKNDDEEDLRDFLIPIPIVVTPEPGPEPRTLTPDGNMNLVDDFRVDTIDEKQFITVTTRNGNYFYIIIDRAGNSENVYFLNMVDELDLLALLEDDVVLPEPQPPPDQNVPLPFLPTQPEPEPVSEPERDISGNIIALVVFLLLAGGVAGFYFKVLKPKQEANKVNSLTDINEFNEFDTYEDVEQNNESYVDERPRPAAPEPEEEPDDIGYIEIEEIPDEESEDDEEYVD